MTDSSSALRHDGRALDGLRPVHFQRRFTRHAEGSVLVSFGDTRVLCTASVLDSVPPFLRGKGQGWVTAEYGMLPRATHTRSDREAARGKQSGRTQEIQRLIGRSLRAVTDLKRLGERTIHLDCGAGEDGLVIGTAWGTTMSELSAALPVRRVPGATVVQLNGASDPLREAVAAISVGIVALPGAAPACVLDLDYQEDSGCETDMNVVMTASGGLVEIQGTAEGTPFSRQQASELLDLAAKGIDELVRLQRAALQEEGA